MFLPTNTSIPFYKKHAIFLNAHFSNLQIIIRTIINVSCLINLYIVIVMNIFNIYEALTPWRRKHLVAGCPSSLMALS